MEKQTKSEPSRMSMAKLVLAVAIIVFLGAVLGVAGWVVKNKPVKPVIQTGIIEGSLSYPSEYIPKEMKVCAENILTLRQYCTEKQINDIKYTYGVGYKIEVPVGNYYVFAAVPNWDYRAYYSEFITCVGLSIECLFHEPILITVKPGETITDINPQDWYNTPEKVVKDETADWKTYRNEEYGFEFNIPTGWEVKEVPSEAFYVFIKSPDYATNTVEPFNVEVAQGAEILVSIRQFSSDLEFKNIKDLQEFNKLGRGGPAFINEQIIKMEGEDALLYDYEDKSGHVLDFLHNDMQITISIRYAKESDGQGIFNQILSTFKFIEKED